eukprot:1506902-Rhodomonas_salina.2
MLLVPEAYRRIGTRKARSYGVGLGRHFDLVCSRPPKRVEADQLEAALALSRYLSSRFLFPSLLHHHALLLPTVFFCCLSLLFSSLCPLCSTLLCPRRCLCRPDAFADAWPQLIGGRAHQNLLTSAQGATEHPPQSHAPPLSGIAPQEFGYIDQQRGRWVTFPHPFKPLSVCVAEPGRMPLRLGGQRRGDRAMDHTHKRPGCR